MDLSPELLDLMLENVDCGIFTVDTDHRVTSWNKAAERITGRRAEEVLGRNCCDLNCLTCALAKDKDDGCCEIFRDGGSVRKECVVLRPDGGTAYVLKTAHPLYDRNGNLLGAVESLTDITALRPDLSSSRAEEEPEGTLSLSGIIGSSQPMRQVYRLMRFAAASESTVLVTGESGTGKELVARAIHILSARSEAPFVAVSCSALPETLLESELFGHVKGAFSGAVSDKVGRFELARGGTVFLDEIGDISPLIQLKLLRILQNQEYQRVGESLSRIADVRVIAATNKNLLSQVRKGEFREDLFFRLKVFPIELPPLRERKKDITELVYHFIGVFNRKTGKKVTRIRPEALKLLLEYCWPGNVRELEHAIEYAFVLCQNEEISPFELPQEILLVEYRKQYCPPGQAGFSSQSAAAGFRPLRWSGRQPPERDTLLQALEASGWNQTAAAQVLGVSRVTVWSWMKKLGINRPGE